MSRTRATALPLPGLLLPDLLVPGLVVTGCSTEVRGLDRTGIGAADAFAADGRVFSVAVGGQGVITTSEDTVMRTGVGGRASFGQGDRTTDSRVTAVDGTRAVLDIGTS